MPRERRKQHFEDAWIDNSLAANENVWFIQDYAHITVANVAYEALGRAVQDGYTADSVLPHGTQCLHEGLVTVNKNHFSRIALRFEPEIKPKLFLNSDTNFLLCQLGQLEGN